MAQDIVQQAADFAEALAFATDVAPEPAPGSDFTAVVKAFEAQIACASLGPADAGEPAERPARMYVSQSLWRHYLSA